MELEQLSSLSESSLNRIVESYGMYPSSGDFGSRSTRDQGFGQAYGIGSGNRGRGEKLVMLLDLLGARDIATQLRQVFARDLLDDGFSRRRALGDRDR